MKTEDVASLVANSSNTYEKNNSELKREYIKKNVLVYNTIVQLVKESVGTFATGYPFYVLDENLNGKFPVIDEQIRYNDELAKNASNAKNKEWICASCLKENYDNLPDLKQICKPCPNMDNNLKPRKVINRLPDLDMWTIVEDGKKIDAAEKLAHLFDLFNFRTSDVDPIQTIKELDRISKDLKNGVMPKDYLPLDSHIIEKSELIAKIKQVPNALYMAKENDTIPYVPISPLSLRKMWQYDDEAYNFVFDFLYSFRPFTDDKDVASEVKNAREQIMSFSDEKDLVKTVYILSSESNRRRMKTSEILKNLLNKFNSWRTPEIIYSGKGKKDLSDDEENER